MKNRTCFYALLVAIIILIIIGASYLPRWYVSRFIDVQENPISTIYSFAGAMRTNDLKAYEYVTTDHHDRLDEWMSNHKVQHCDRIPDEQASGGAVTLPGGPTYYDTIFYCYVDNIGKYVITIDDITLAEQEGKFFISGWEDPVESIE